MRFSFIIILPMRFLRSRRKSLAKINLDLCLVCGACVAVCPEALDLEGNRLTFRQEVCKACGECIAVCPTGALSGDEG